MLSGRQVATIRKQRGWSQQFLANQSGVNKAYISEYETGIRPTLPERMLERLEESLLNPPVGRTSPQIQEKAGRLRLVLTDEDGNPLCPPVASVQWTETDGTTYTMYLGEPESD